MRLLADEEVTLKLGRGEVRVKPVHLEPAEIARRVTARLGLVVVDARGAALVGKVVPGGVGERLGIRPGDAILQVGAQEVRSAAAYNQAIGGLRLDSDAVLLVGRGPFAYYVTAHL